MGITIKQPSAMKGVISGDRKVVGSVLSKDMLKAIAYTLLMRDFALLSLL
jgi:hypothetical protein